jgi:hypothetical protein
MNTIITRQGAKTVIFEYFERFYNWHAILLSAISAQVRMRQRMWFNLMFNNIGKSIFANYQREIDCNEK